MASLQRNFIFALFIGATALVPSVVIPGSAIFPEPVYLIHLTSLHVNSPCGIGPIFS